MSKPLLLASGSPRRRELLESANIPFEVLVPNIEERRREGETLPDYVLRNANEKALAIATAHPDRLVLAADTVVVLDDTLLEKPHDDADAMRMLRDLSGSTHEVWTAVCIRTATDIHFHNIVRTEVEFVELSDEAIRRYVATGEPMDKAGAYGIQGRAAAFVRAIRGSYTNVVGLPLAEVVDVIAP